MKHYPIRTRFVSWLLPAAILCAATLSSASTAVAEDLVLFRPGNSMIAEGSEAVLRTAYLELGVNLLVEPMQGQVALERSLAGESDGEVHRIYALGEQQTSLIRVPTSIGNIATVAVSAPGSDVSISDIDDLAQYRIGRIDGILHSAMVAEHLEGVQIFPDQTALLNAGRERCD